MRSGLAPSRSRPPLPAPARSARSYPLRPLCPAVKSSTSPRLGPAVKSSTSPPCPPRAPLDSSPVLRDSGCLAMPRWPVRRTDAERNRDFTRSGCGGLRASIAGTGPGRGPPPREANMHPDVLRAIASARVRDRLVAAEQAGQARRARRAARQAQANPAQPGPFRRAKRPAPVRHLAAGGSAAGGSAAGGSVARGKAARGKAAEGSRRAAHRAA